MRAEQSRYALTPHQSLATGKPVQWPCGASKEQIAQENAMRAQDMAFQDAFRTAYGLTQPAKPARTHCLP